MGLVLNAHEPINSSALSRSSRHQEDFFAKKRSLYVWVIYTTTPELLYITITTKIDNYFREKKMAMKKATVSYSYKLLYIQELGLAPISRADHMKHHDLLSKGCSILQKS